MNTDAQILNKIPENWDQQYIIKKGSYTMIKWDLRVGGFFNIHKSINMIHHKLKNKNNIIISEDAQKAFNNIHHPFMI